MKILVIAPHQDDEVLGCGGIIAKHVAKGDKVYVCVVTKATEPVFTKKDVEIDLRETKNAHKFLGVTETIYLDFPAAMLETVPRHELNGAFINLIQKVKPEEVYIPFRGDMHIDHKMVADACMVALRPVYKHKVNRIYAYETLSETEWDAPTVDNVFAPNVYEDITDYLDKKISAMKQYKTKIQKYPNPRSAEGIKALAMHRGGTVCKKYAESFMLLRSVK